MPESVFYSLCPKCRAKQTKFSSKLYTTDKQFCLPFCTRGGMMKEHRRNIARHRGYHMDKDTLFRHGKIAPTIFKLAIPLVISQLINVLYNVVDRIYISNIPEIGNDAFGGLNICFPILMIVSAFSSLLGMGGAPLLSIKLGQNKKDEASDILHTSFVMLILIGAVLTAILLIFRTPLLYLFGAKDEIIGYSLDYLTYYAIGTIAVMLSLGLNAFASAQGHTVVAMITVSVGALINIILDPILIYACGMNVKGAAIATVVSQIVSAIWITAFLFGKKPAIRLQLRKMRIRPRLLLSILALGVSPFIMQSTESLVQITFNLQIRKYATPEQYLTYLNMMSIFLTVMQMIMLPLSGIAQGATPMISYNYGSGDLVRVKKSYLVMLAMTSGYSMFMYLTILIFPSLYLKAFSPDETVLAIGPNMMRLFFLGLSFMGVQTACQNSFMALKQPLISLLLAMLRKIVLLIPLTLLLPLAWDVKGIFYAEPISDAIAIAVTATTFAIAFPRILRKRAMQPDLSNASAVPSESETADNTCADFQTEEVFPDSVSTCAQPEDGSYYAQNRPNDPTSSPTRDA